MAMYMSKSRVVTTLVTIASPCELLITVRYKLASFLMHEPMQNVTGITLFIQL